MKHAGKTIAVVAALAAAGAATWPLASTIWTGIIRAGHAIGWIAAALLIVVALLAAAAAAEKTLGKAASAVLVAAALAGFVAILVVGSSTSHNRLDWYFSDQVTVTDDPPPAFELREPYITASRLLRRSAGQEFSNVRVHDAYFTDSSAEWATVIDGRGWFLPTQAVLARDGRDFRSCRMDGLDRALDGSFANSVKREINKEIRGTGMELSDAAAVCSDDGDATVYLSLWRYHGIVQPARVPAAVVEIDADGVYTVHDDPGDFDVPVVPYTTVQQVVQTLPYLDPATGETSGRLSAFARSRRTGLEAPEGASRPQDQRVDTDADGADARNPDAEAHGEYLMQAMDGRYYYVSALTPLGDNERITALAVAPADRLEPGEPPEVTIHELGDDERLSNREVNDRLRTVFDSDVAWEAGYETFEIAPYRDGTWSVTIGQSLELPFRAIVDADGEACLYRQATGGGDGLVRIACTEHASDTARGLADPVSDEDQPSPEGAVPDSLADLSEGELLELLDAVGRELRSR